LHSHPHADTDVVQERLTRLVYELLDAHDDTAQLAAEPADELCWETHLDYLRDLQRAGRELLAECGAR
jgi:hypothetical protein